MVALAASEIALMELRTSDSGGKVTYYGSDPITPDRLPYEGFNMGRYVYRAAP
jgi:hypothetical protein